MAEKFERVKILKTQTIDCALYEAGFYHHVPEKLAADLCGRGDAIREADEGKEEQPKPAAPVTAKPTASPAVKEG